jgi:Flp pilus assembly protein TadD
MKKSIIIGLGMLASYSGFAQSLAFENAVAAMTKGNMVEAKKFIDEATQKEVKDARIYFTKAAIYQTLADDPKTESTAANGHEVALEAYKKYISLDAKYKAADIKPNIINLAIAGYNKGIGAYNSQQYTDAIKGFGFALDALGIDNNKVCAGDKWVDTITAQITMFKGYSYFNDKKYEEAKPLMEKAVDNPIVRDASLMLNLSQTLSFLGKNEERLALLEKGQKLYPQNKDFRNEVINYYILTNKSKELVEKLEQACIEEPKDAELQFSLGTSYEEMYKAAVKDKAPNANELETKLLAAYEKAQTLDPKRGDYSYNIAAHHYNKAADIGKEMNANTKDKAKYNSLNGPFMQLLAKSEPFFTKAVGLYEAPGSVREADKLNYKNSLLALQEIYKNQNAKEKQAAITKKLMSL